MSINEMVMMQHPGTSSFLYFSPDRALERGGSHSPSKSRARKATAKKAEGPHWVEPSGVRPEQLLLRSEDAAAMEDPVQWPCRLLLSLHETTQPVPRNRHASVSHGCRIAWLSYRTSQTGLSSNYIFVIENKQTNLGGIMQMNTVFRLWHLNSGLLT